MSKHTPAPWELRISHYEPEAYDITAAGVGALALVKSKPDAQLIAAAPDLLELAQDVISAMTADEELHSVMLLGLAHRARKAIAKATGGSDD